MPGYNRFIKTDPASITDFSIGLKTFRSTLIDTDTTTVFPASCIAKDQKKVLNKNDEEMICSIQPRFKTFMRIDQKTTQYTNVIVFISNEEKRKSTQSKTLTKNHSKL